MIKHPADNKWYHFYNANPAGKRAGDCVIRALCTVFKDSWENTYRSLAELCIKKFIMVDEKSGYENFFKLKNIEKQKQPRKENNTKFTGREFCDYINKNNLYKGKRIFAHIGGHHVVCIMEDPKDYKFRIFDIWDSSKGCVGNFWVV